MDERLLRGIFGEVIRGYSEAKIDSKPVYIRHLDYLTISEIDGFYSQFYKEAQEQQIPSEAARLEFLKKTGQWTNKEEQIIKNAKGMISGLEANRKTAFLESQIQQITQQLKRERATLAVFLNKKASLIGSCIETVVNKRINYLYIKHSLYSDTAFKFPLISDDTMEYILDAEFLSIEQVYNNELDKFQTNNLQKIALLPLCQNLFALSESKAQNFFGRAVIYLTIYQEEFLRYCGYFKQILENSHNIPVELFSEPEKLINWYISGKNLKEAAEKGGTQGGTTSIVGASKQDLAKIDGANINNFTHLDQLKKKGGKSFTMADVLGMENNKK